MANKTGYWAQHKKDLKYTLLLAGLVLILFGVLMDLAWLESIAACYAMDGECLRSAVVNYKAVIPTGIGFFVLLAISAGYPGLLFKRPKLEIVLDFSILFILILFAVSSQVRYFNNDEYEHLHNAWLMAEGTLPHFDWTMKHMPLLEWITILFMGLTGEHTILIQTMRFFIFLTTCGSLWMVYLIAGKLFQTRLHAVIAVALVLGNHVWVYKSPEIRPDNLMVFLSLVSFWFLMKYDNHRRIKDLVIVCGMAVMAMLAKQNAAVYYLPVAGVFLYQISFSEGKRNFKPLLIAFGALAIFFIIPYSRDFLITNIQRHLLPNDIRFTPWTYLREALSFNPTVFLLFLFQIVYPLNLTAPHRRMKPYLYAVILTAFLFLFIMNRPFKQEMLIMVVFMSIVGAPMLVDIVTKLGGRLAYMLSVVILVPAVYYMFTDGLGKTWTSELETTKDILRISKRDDLVFDSYGKAIFRHHPLEPDYLIYIPSKFDRLSELKKSGVKYMIVDFYTRGLPADTIDWLEQNFKYIPENKNICIRADNPLRDGTEEEG